MALYEYVCKKCGKKFDLMLPMSKSDDPQKCPDCGGETEQQIGLSSWTWGSGKHWSL